ncbi:MAG: TonB-dependent receptor [Paludibacter sp.]
MKKTGFIPRIILLSFFLLVVTIHVTAQKVTLSYQNVPFEKVLNSIKQQTGLALIFSEQLVDVNRKVSINATSVEVGDALTQLLAGTNVSFEIKNNKLYLVEKQIVKSQISPNQSKKITGLVTDEKGEPIIGASVVLKGSNTGTITNIDGMFTIEAQEQSGITISYIGYKPTLFKVGKANSYKITLEEDLKALDEVVVVGYSTQKRETMTGSVATVKSAELVRTPIPSVSNALAGQAPGLISVQSQGVPGADAAQLSIRGFGSALVIIDGIESDFNNIDAGQIESISILKDASAAIYGSRAGNGVILITTKRGLIQKPTINVNSSLTFMSLTAFPKPASAGQASEMDREAWIQSGKPANTAPFTLDQIQKYYNGTDPNYPNTDWFNVLVRPWTPMQQHDVSLRGGTEKLKYYGYLGYLNQPTFFKSNGGDYERYNIQSTIEATITDKLSMQVNLTNTLENRDFPNLSFAPGTESGWLQIWAMDPRSSSSFPDPTKTPFNHGFAHVNSNRQLGGTNDDYTKHMRGDVILNYNFDEYVKGLSVKYTYSYLEVNDISKQWWNPVDLYKYDYDLQTYSVVGHLGDKGVLSQFSTLSRTITNQASLIYDRTFASDHHLKMLAVYESIDNSWSGFGSSRRDFISPLIQQLYAGSTDGQSIWGSATEMARKSYIGRINYTYKGKYLFESSFRGDASAKFPANSRWGYFPSVSLGWNIAKEDFLSKKKTVDYLKTRLSYGNSGNDNVANFDYLTGYTIGNSYLYGNTANQSIVSKGLANPNLTWEKISISNFGIDYSFFDMKLYGAVDVFYRVRTGIPGTRLLTLDPSFGALLPMENINSLDDRGFEFSVGSKGKVGEFSYDLNANISWSRAKWIHYEEPVYTDPDQIRLYKKSGQWVDQTFGYRSAGLFTSQDQIDNLGYNMDQKNNVSLKPGDVKLLDVNGDKVVNWRDQVLLGEGLTPHFMTGLNFSLKYKNFDLAGLFQGAFDYMTNIYIPRGIYPYTPSALQYTLRWTEANNDPNALVSRLGGNSNGDGSDYRLINASYLRLKNFSFGYNFSDKLLKKSGLKQARISVSGTNVLTFSRLAKYDIDPEAPSGLSGNYYPQQKTISMGINLSF